MWFLALSRGPPLLPPSFSLPRKKALFLVPSWARKGEVLLKTLFSHCSCKLGNSGFEPLTCSLWARCSTYWANRPNNFQHYCFFCTFSCFLVCFLNFLSPFFIGACANLCFFSCFWCFFIKKHQKQEKKQRFAQAPIKKGDKKFRKQTRKQENVQKKQ